MAKAAKGACELKSGSFSLMRLALYSRDWNSVQSWVADQISQAPEFFAQAPIALDCSRVNPAPDQASLEDLLHRLRYAGVQPFAILADAESKLGQAAAALNLLCLPAETRKLAEPIEAEIAPLAPEIRAAAPPARLPRSALLEATEVRVEAQSAPPKVEIRTETKIVKQIEQVVVDGVLPPQVYTGPVRSGQQLYAKQRDLIVTGSSAPGSEVIADGSIHLYGKLMGKIIAGAAGDREAKIYCLSFGAELVSIAGIFRVFEAIPRDIAGRPVMISLNGDKLHIEPL